MLQGQGGTAGGAAGAAGKGGAPAAMNGGGKAGGASTQGSAGQPAMGVGGGAGAPSSAAGGGAAGASGGAGGGTSEPDAGAPSQAAGGAGGGVGAGGGGAVEAVGFSDVFQLLVTSCGNCHGANAPNNRPKFAQTGNEAASFAVTQTASGAGTIADRIIAEAVTGSDMPPACANNQNACLGAAQKAELQAWVDQGANP
jgi:hypothetical protein